MGINDEYSRDAYLGDHYVYDSEESDELHEEIDPEEWQIYYSEEIHDGWSTLLEYIHDNYMTTKATYSEFADFVTWPSELSWNPSVHAVRSWEALQKVPIIKERIVPEQWYTWFDSFV
jgi:hypothetical protein